MPLHRIAPICSRFLAPYKNADGSCTATPVDLTAGTTYKIAENDFMATGGDGYPNFANRMTTQDIMEQVAADYITANSPLTPVVRAFPGRPDQLRGLQWRGAAELPDVGSVSVAS